MAQHMLRDVQGILGRLEVSKLCPGGSIVGGCPFLGLEHHLPPVLQGRNNGQATLAPEEMPAASPTEREPMEGAESEPPAEPAAAEEMPQSGTEPPPVAEAAAPR